MTEDADQHITGKVSFEKDVRAWTVTGPFHNIDEIRNLISDVVLDYGKLVEIGGRKLFEDGFATDSLTVIGDLGIPVIDRVNILEFNDSVVRKNRDDTIAAPLIFLQDVKIERLRANDADLNASIGVAVRTVDVLPSNVVFENLAVLGNVHLKNLDGIDFDEFVSDRVTLRGDHNVFCDMKFNGLVTITGSYTNHIIILISK